MVLGRWQHFGEFENSSRRFPSMGTRLHIAWWPNQIDAKKEGFLRHVFGKQFADFVQSFFLLPVSKAILINQSRQRHILFWIIQLNVCPCHILYPEFLFLCYIRFLFQWNHTPQRFLEWNFHYRISFRSFQTTLHTTVSSWFILLFGC